MTESNVIPFVEKVTSLNDYQKKALRTANSNNNDDLLLNGVMGMCGEAGECIDMVKKSVFQGHVLNTEELAKELGDVLWYIAITAKALGYKMSDIATMNIDKLMARYPEGFDTNRSIYRPTED